MSEIKEATACGGFFVGEVSITLRRGRPVLFSAGTVVLVVFMLGVGEFLVERLFLFIRQGWVEIFDRIAGLLRRFLHDRSEEHTSEVQSRPHLVGRPLLE